MLFVFIYRQDDGKSSFVQQEDVTNYMDKDNNKVSKTD